jgi:hypothetical protein
MDLWKIIRTGLREQYMSVGYERPESAKNEIKKLIRDSKKFRKLGINPNIVNSQEILRVPTPLIGKNWRIKKIKVRPA